MKVRYLIGLALVVSASSIPTLATPLGSDASSNESSRYADAVREGIESYVVVRGFRTRTEAARLVRERIANSIPGIAAAAPVVGTAVRGSVGIPVLTTLFESTVAPPYPVANLQRQLFDGPWPSGTMTEHYAEMSGGKLLVQGQVHKWIKLSKSEEFYAGPSGCNGTCANARTGELLNEALRQADQTIDFTQFDNDGPDGMPNSGDDDGFVDFVAFVHPSLGGECAIPGNSSIWSHRWRISNWAGNNSFETNDSSVLGPRVRIDDYVIMPALACDKATMIPIGVFSHEFGHAFGLPDLYDSQQPFTSSGIGTWGLMASGSWGGDNNHPETPSHMETWSKEFLGWATVREIVTDTMQVELRPTFVNNDAIRVDYSDAADPEDSHYLLLEYRKRQGFDSSLYADGLLVTEINNARVRSGLVTNGVNGEPFDMGVNVIEADGQRSLDKGNGRGDAGDVFGSAGLTHLDGAHAEKVRAALCNISLTADSVVLDIYVSRQTCPEMVSASAVSPATAAQTGVVGGAELVIEGTLENAGTNFFNDLNLVVRGADGSEISVTSPIVQDSATPLPGLPDPSLEGQQPSSSHSRLPDLLGKKVIVRGDLQRLIQKGTGMTETLRIKELQVSGE